MEIGNQLRLHRRNAHMSQEELADRVYVSRQTVSNWETGKSYPDIHSLVMLSEVFQISLDELIKGDLPVMKQAISQESVQDFKRLSRVFSVLFVLLIVLAVPLFIGLGPWALVPWAVLYTVTMYFGFRVEKLKKANDIHTYREILAFCEGKRLDEIQTQREIGKRPYQKALSVLAGAGIGLLIAGILSLIL